MGLVLEVLPRLRGSGFRGAGDLAWGFVGVVVSHRSGRERKGLVLTELKTAVQPSIPQNILAASSCMLDNSSCHTRVCDRERERGREGERETAQGQWRQDTALPSHFNFASEKVDLVDNGDSTSCKRSHPPTEAVRCPSMLSAEDPTPNQSKDQSRFTVKRRRVGSRIFPTSTAWTDDRLHHSSRSMFPWSKKGSHGGSGRFMFIR